ncbi:MAG TPA: hypothetical protein GXX25_07835 [Desulfotomaculum sp.]|nr:hypothetical protein [Desulfotomaculum sp.]
MFMKNVALVLYLLLMPWMLTAGERSTLHRTAIPAEEREIIAVIRGAVEDDSWWQAGNVGEVRAVLSRYYAEPLLSHLSEQAWQFIAQPTDWYSRTTVTHTGIYWQSNREAIVQASLLSEDVTSGEKIRGEADFSLHKTEAGWHITRAVFRWDIPGE